MQCPTCGADNPSEAHFCGHCGAQIASAFSGKAGPVDLTGGLDDPAAEPPAVEPVITEPVPDYTEPAFVEPSPAPQPPPTAEPVPPPAAPPGAVPPPPNPHAPGAGIAPPASAQSTSPPPNPAPGMPSQAGYQPHQMGNTSGMGEGYPPPPEAEGWTFAGFIPYGIYSFVNGNTLWGILWWVFSLFSLSIVYWIVVGLNGKKQAWQGRRFDSLEQFTDTMKSWNTWGLVCLILGIVFTVFIGLIYAGAMIAVINDPSFFDESGSNTF